MKLKRIYICEDSVDGIFTAIYLAWSSRYGHNNIKIEAKSKGGHYTNLELFSDYITVDTDYELALKVAKSIKEKISLDVYEILCRIALSNYEAKADLMYRFLILGFHLGPKVMECLSNEIVNQIFRINKNVNNEVHHMLGFVRFSQQENGLLTSVIHPKNNVISLITPHFVDRLPEEKFVIYDENRHLASLHIPSRPWVLLELSDLDKDIFKQFTYDEDSYKDLWKIFFQRISIKERENYKLQRNNLPLRFRKDMTEFQP